MAVATPSRCPSPPSGRSTANAAAACAIVLAIATTACGGLTTSDPTAPGPRTIDFSPLLATGPKLQSRQRLAVAIDPSHDTQVMTSGSSGDQSPSMLIVSADGGCSAEARLRDDVGRLATYGSARVETVELELGAEGDDGMPTPSNAPAAYVGTRDTAGTWHWKDLPETFVHEPGAQRKLRARFVLEGVGPITAISFCTRPILDPRSIVKISYHVVGP